MLSEKIRVIAYQLGENIHLKNFKAAYEGSIHSSSSTDVLIKRSEHSYIYVQNYGEVAFAECDEATIADFIAFVKRFIDAPISSELEYKEEFIIDINPEYSINLTYNSIQVPEINTDVIKIIMLNVSQSVVLDYFTELSHALLHATTNFTKELELNGKLNISKKNLMKFIGKTLNTQNRIIDNLYFLDAPDTVWDNEYLAKINSGLSKTFDLKTRFREVEYTLKIIDNNLSTFAQLVQHRESNKLELIIIFLILFEIINVFLAKFF